MSKANSRPDNPAILEWVNRITAGDRKAVTPLVEAIQGDIYRLSLRMLGDSAEAQDATQDILLRVLTHLASFQGKSAFRTWVFRVATNHLLNRKQGQKEFFSFEMLEGFITQGLGAEMPDMPEAEIALLAEEVKLGCSEGALLSLDRDHRVAYMLGELFDFSGEEAAAILEIEPAAYRKRLQRANERLGAFMGKNCGLVDPKNACRCARMVGPSMAVGFLDPKRPRWVGHPRTAAAEKAGEHKGCIDSLLDRVSEIQREHPAYAAPEGMLAKVRELLGSADL